MHKDIKIILQNLDMLGQKEFLRLMSYKMLLSTRVKDWKGSSNEFVNLKIPSKVYDFFEDYSDNPDNEKLLTLLINDLIIRGIMSIAAEFGDEDTLEMLIKQVIYGESAFLDENQPIN